MDLVGEGGEGREGHSWPAHAGGEAGGSRAAPRRGRAHSSSRGASVAMHTAAAGMKSHQSPAVRSHSVVDTLRAPRVQPVALCARAPRAAARTWQQPQIKALREGQREDRRDSEGVRVRDWDQGREGKDHIREGGRGEGENLRKGSRYEHGLNQGKIVAAGICKRTRT